MNDHTQANREAWNAVAQVHYENYHLPKLLAGEPLINELIQAEVGDVHGKSLIHLLCHIGTDTLSWGLLGARVTGVDISPAAIRYARSLASQLGMQADFIVSDVMDLMEKVDATYDIVFSSTGVLCWIPNIQKFAATVRHLLKPGGFFYLFDGHPIRAMLGTTESGETIVQHDYFATGVQEYDNFTDYILKDFEFPGKSYEWSWTLADVVTAFCQNRMRLAFLHEHPEYYYGGYTAFDEALNKREFFPQTFSFKAFAE